MIVLPCRFDSFFAQTLKPTYYLSTFNRCAPQRERVELHFCIYMRVDGSIDSILDTGPNGCEPVVSHQDDGVVWEVVRGSRGPVFLEERFGRGGGETGSKRATE